MRRSRWLALVLALWMGEAMAAWFGDLFAGSPPATLGARDGRLAPCPDKPNCVSSQVADDAHKVAPIPFADAPAAAQARAVAAIRATAGARVVTERDGYIHAEYQSKLMGFVDDLELVVDQSARVLHVRSASRLGYGDMGVNRARVDALRATLGAGSK